MPLMEDLYAKQRARQVELLPFSYSTSFQNSVLAASTTISQNIQVQSDSHFVCRYVNALAYTGGLAVFTTIAALLINFFDSGSGRTLMDSPQPIQNLCGGLAAGGGAFGNLPFIWPEPWMIKAGSTIQVSVTNLSTTLAIVRLDVSLIGIKVFTFGQSTPGQIY